MHVNKFLAPRSLFEAGMQACLPPRSKKCSAMFFFIERHMAAAINLIKNSFSGNTYSLSTPELAIKLKLRVNAHGVGFISKCL